MHWSYAAPTRVSATRFVDAARDVVVLVTPFVPADVDAARGVVAMVAARGDTVVVPVPLRVETGRTCVAVVARGVVAVVAARGVTVDGAATRAFVDSDDVRETDCSGARDAVAPPPRAVITSAAYATVTDA